MGKELVVVPDVPWHVCIVVGYSMLNAQCPSFIS